ncbi:hypothetical protein [Kitasatospora sp. NPDC059571]|uniref:hypothetical protein n=1 Tax=Kitasatospora sp. NPDC059571 TaxID=3346871 RepID=UPI00367BC83D
MGAVNGVPRGLVPTRMRSVGGALRYAERVLLAGGQRQARQNAWAAVCENRRHAAERELDGSGAGLSGDPAAPAPVGRKGA